MEIKKHIGDKVREKRKVLNMRQEDLANEVGVSRTHINGIEQGRDYTTIEGLYTLSRVLKCQPHDLLPKIETKKRSLKK